MAETTKVTPHTDWMIEEDIYELLMSFTPVKHDRHRIQTNVSDGHVTVKGYVKGRPAYTYLVHELPRIPGVNSVDTSELYFDENIRIQTGNVVPLGVLVAVEYGAVILSGKVPEDESIEALVKKVAQVPGVHRVLTSF